METKNPPYFLLTIVAVIFLASFYKNQAFGASGSAYVSGTNIAGGTSPSVSYNSTKGDTIIALVVWQNTVSTPTVSDTINGSYGSIVGPLRGTSFLSMQAFCFYNSAGGSNTVSVSGLNNNGGLAVAEYSGVAGCTPDAISTAGPTTGLIADSGSVSITNPNDIIVGLFGDTVASSMSPGTDGQGHDMTMRQTNNETMGIEDFTESSIANYKATAIWNSSSQWLAAMVALKGSSAPADTLPPTVPTNLSATAVSSSQINLSFTASTDNVGVTGYDIYRCSGSNCTPSSPAIAQVTSATSYSDTSLTPSTGYTYTVDAYDAAGNNSPQSASASATTQASQTVTGNNIYIAQTQAGSANGADCADALPVSFFNTSSNWAATPTSGKISPGTTVHLCGTFTGAAGSIMLTTQGNGVSGDPIIILFEPGSVMNAPYWGSATVGAVNVINNFITVDGGTNGLIKNTADGDALTYQQASVGVYLSNCSNDIVRNLTIGPIYIHTEDVNESGAVNAQGSSTAAINETNCNNILFTGNTTLDAQAAIGGGPSGSTNSNIEISNNTMTNCNRCVIVGVTTDTQNGVLIHDNNFAGGAYLWDEPDNAYHHNAIHLFNTTSGHVNNIQIYNNYVHGIWGKDASANHTTSMFFLETLSGTGNDILIYNNLLTPNDKLSTPTNGMIFCKISNTCDIYNNTIIGINNGSDFGMAVECNTPQTVNAKNNIIAYMTAYYNCNWGQMDFNIYSGVDSWDLSTFSGWQGRNFDAHGQSTANLKLDLNYKPQYGSPAIAAGVNLTFLGISALNTDASGTPRPTTGPWDIGAYQYSSSGGSGSSPVISSFSASPSSLTYGGSSTLSWNITGATSVSIDNGIGSQSSLTSGSVSVSPQVSTAYTLTAINSSGSVTSQTTVTVTPNPDTTPPTAAITSPSSGAASGSITFSASASDPTVTGQVTSGLKSLTLSVDGSAFATSTTGSITKPLYTTTLSNGSHSLTATAVDNAGNSFTTSALSITVNNTVATKYPRLITLTSLEGIPAIPSSTQITVTVLSPTSGTTLETQSNLTPSSNGQYTVTFLSSDPQIVNIRVKVNGYLSQLLTSVDTTVNSASALSVPQLLAGDSNNDNTINSLDYSLMNQNWLKSGIGDINLDGIVNSLDFAILKNDFNKQGN